MSLAVALPGSEVQGGHWGLGKEVPPAGLRGGVRAWGLRSLQKPGIMQTICSCQMLYLSRFVTESVLHLPSPPQKKTTDLRKSHDPTVAGVLLFYYFVRRIS